MVLRVPMSRVLFLFLQLFKNTTLHFKVTNSKPLIEVISKRKGLGLENVRRRLKLLYPNAHILEIDNMKKAYCVNLSIDLNVH